MSTRLFLTVVLCAAFAGCGGDEPKQAATIFVAKSIVTMNPDQPRAEAVAVVGDRVLAVGSLAEVEAACEGREVSTDRTFADHVISAGFIDPHLHPFLGAILMPMDFVAPEDWNFIEKQSKGVTTPEAYLAAMKALEASKPEGEWLWTWGYHRSFHGDVNRPELDAISKTRPIIQWHRSFHEIVMNTAALEALGITKADVEGKPQSSWEDGHFYENGLIVAAPKILPILMEPTRWKRGLRMQLSNMQARGIVCIADLAAGSFGDRELELMKSVFDTDDVPMRTYLIPLAKFLYDQFDGDSAKIAEHLRSWSKHDGKRVTFLTKHAKLLADGAFFSQYMQLRDGYEDGHEGEWIMAPEALQKSVRALWDEGIQIHVHVNGDLGVKSALDALDACLQATPREDHRYTLEHLGICWPEQMARAAKLGCCVSGNPFYLHSMGEKYAEVGVGMLRAKHIFRAGSVVKNGLPLALHSDCLMAPADPLLLAWCAVNRQGLSGRVLGPDEKISVQEAMEAITIDAAYVLRKEDDLGSIEPGKRADFTILEEDPFEVDPVRLKDIAVWGTVFEGRKVPAATR